MDQLCSNTRYWSRETCNAERSSAPSVRPVREGASDVAGSPRMRVFVKFAVAIGA